jgi:pimeloyl-ACP methyl ester carboxylesterase
MRSVSVEPKRWLTSDGTELHGFGFGQGPAILMMNGLGPSWQVWNRQLAHFGDRYRFVGWDYRGLYRDQAPAHSVGPARHAADALEVLEQEGLDRAAVIAWSFGVPVALELFRLAPQRLVSLVFVNGAANVQWTAASAGLRRVYPGLLKAGGRAPGVLPAALSGWLASPEAFAWGRRLGLLGGELDQEAYARVAERLTQLDLHHYFEGLRALAAHDASDVLARIDLPTLVIGSDRDPLVSRAGLEQLVQGVAGAQYLQLPGAAHFVMLDHAQHVNLRIEKFFGETGFAAEVGRVA